ncbi:MAG: hypothetical protein ACRDO7_10680 [Nocardioidaceae bacterium]
MKRIKPTLDGVDAARADAFARWRILALRASSRRRDYRPRLSLVACDDINRAQHLPEDIASWEPPTRTAHPIDAGLAVEITARLLHQVDGGRVTAVWTRRGPNEATDSDIGWWSAVRHGAAIAEVPTPSLLVITRWGWHCLPYGTGRTWQRLRPTG